MKRKENNDSSVPRSTYRNVLQGYSAEHFGIHVINQIGEKCYGRVKCSRTDP